ncbi:MAG: diaminopimelate epimerase [Candidatus Algichlamydia australiensis]|nr:diaminopimelate epimerase [Chlamydiales bacterium]
MKFIKIEGAGNDFIVMEGPVLVKSEIVRLCDRRKGIGADGLIFVSESACADIKFIYYNADGSRADFCGNGLRATARYMGYNCTIESDCGLHFAKFFGKEIAVNVPSPKFIKKNFFYTDEGALHYVHVGVPHAILHIKNFEQFNYLAKKLRHDPRFGEAGANIHFSKELEDGKIEVRTFERGVEGETFACGSGGAAVFLTFNAKEATICFRSGDEVRYFYEGKYLMMQGPARKIFTGEIDANWHTERDQDSRIPSGGYSEQS